MNLRRYPCAPSAVQNHLIRYQIRQILSRPLEERLALIHLAARTFIPKTGSLTFDSPIQRLGDVVLVVLSRHFDPDPDSNPGETLFLRGYKAEISPTTATTHWGHQTSVFAYNFAQRMRPDAWGGVLPLESTAIARVGLDMDRCCQRQANRMFPYPGQPVLPPTLLGLPRGTTINPQPTPTVLAHARDFDLSWEYAWHDLHRQWCVPDEVNHTGYDLIDTRLCTRVHPASGWPGSLCEYHDLRGFIDRAIFNPGREPALPLDLSDDRILAAMRNRLPPDLAAACRDEDLAAAAGDLRAPLFVSGLAKIQVWHPLDDATRPESFRFEGHGHEADLWNVKACWMRSIHGVSSGYAIGAGEMGLDPGPIGGAGTVSV